MFQSSDRYDLSFTNIALQIQAYASMLADRHDQGFDLYLLTFMFSHIPGRKFDRLETMKQELDRFYGALLTRVIRCPDKKQGHELPLMITSPDMPVYKREKISLNDVTINDGMHFHAIYGVPPASRLRTELHKHLEAYRDLYQVGYLDRVNAEPIKHDVHRVTDYVFKQIPRRWATFDDIIIFPRTAGEMTERRRNWWHEKGPRR
jgi:hypothetical protein